MPTFLFQAYQEISNRKYTGLCQPGHLLGSRARLSPGAVADSLLRPGRGGPPPLCLLHHQGCRLHTCQPLPCGSTALHILDLCVTQPLRILLTQTTKNTYILSHEKGSLTLVWKVEACEEIDAVLQSCFLARKSRLIGA